MGRLFLTALLALTILPAAACSSDTENETGLGSVSDSLGIDASGGTLVTGSNSPGGFHGDGLTFVEITYDDDSILNQIEENATWSDLPISKVTEILLYGASDGANSYSPYITADEKALFPRIENGYYYFRDRHDQSTDPADDSQVLDRASINVTVAVYDADARTLYYCEYDS